MAIVASTANVVPTMMEKVNAKLPALLVKQQSEYYKMFQNKMDKHNVSVWTDGTVSAFRVPVQTSRGGVYSGITLDGGDLGTGQMMTTGYMTLGDFESDIAFNIPARAAQATGTAQQAITNVLQDSLGSVIDEMAKYDEIGWFTDGTGVLATAASVPSSLSSTTATYTLDTAFSFIRLRGYNAVVDIYDSGNTLRATGGKINSINFATNSVTITGLTNSGSYAFAAGDQITFTSQVNNTIGTTTLAAGSWRYSLYTFNTTSTSGSLLGLSYASTYELACNVVNGGSGYYTPSVMLSAKSQLIQRRDDKAFAGTVGVCHMAQAASWYEQGVTISNWFRGQGSNNMPDLVPAKFGSTFTAGEVEHYVSRYANKTRVDWSIPANFGKVQLEESAFFRTPDGQKVFVGRSATTGNPTAGFQFYAVSSANFYCMDPGANVVMYNLAIPSGQ